MTQKEFYTSITNGEVTEEMKTYAGERLNALEAMSEKRREKTAEKDIEKAPIRELLFSVVTDEPKTATTLISETNLDLKPQSIPSLLKPFIDEKKIEKTELKVKGKGIQRAYRLSVL